jgi:hypothetical protein
LGCSLPWAQSHQHSTYNLPKSWHHHCGKRSKVNITLASTSSSGVQ